jgi:hypothetical protein
MTGQMANTCRNQPLKGLTLVIASGLASIVSIYALMPAVGLTIIDSLNYLFVFFFWAFCFLSFFDNWPFSNIPQPWRGLLIAGLSCVLAVLSWNLLVVVLSVPGDPTIGPYNALAVTSYTEFFLFMLAWFYDTWPVRGLAQPWKGLVLMTASIAGGLVVFAVVGAISQMWLYYIPMWLVPPALDYWPTANMKPHIKGTVWLVFILVATWLTDLMFEAAGVPLHTARGFDFASIVFGSMLYLYAFGGWPFQTMIQPLKGIWLMLATLFVGAIILPELLWSVFNVGDNLAGLWVFMIWGWLVVFLWLSSPEPSLDSLPEPAEGAPST